MLKVYVLMVRGLRLGSWSGVRGQGKGLWIKGQPRARASRVGGQGLMLWVRIQGSMFRRFVLRGQYSMFMGQGLVVRG